MLFSKSNKIFTTTFPKTSTSKLTNFARQRAKENLIRDLKPILQVARIFGIAPYTFSKRNLTLSKTGIMYSATCFIWSCYIYIQRIQGFMGINAPIKVTLLYIAIMVSSAICMGIDIFTCILCDKMQQQFFHHVIEYDVSAKFENRKKNQFVAWSWVLLFLYILLNLIIIMVAWYFDENPNKSIISFLIFCSTLALAIFKFLAFAMIICLRFRDHNLKLLRGLTCMLTMEENDSVLHFREAWQHHECLSSAANILNSMYTIRLLFWFSFSFLTCILQIFGAVSKSYSFFVVLNNFIISFLFILLLIAIAIVCHLTAYEANKMGGLLSLPKYFQRYSLSEKQDICLIGQHFQLNSFHFSAFGLFNINLSVLLTVASTMTTYLVILMSPNER